MELKNSTDQTPELGQADVFKRRNNRGCKSTDFYNWPEQPLEEMDSPLAVQQYIQQLIHRDPADIDEILRLPEGQDLGAWKIEHLRLFCMQLSRLAARLQDCCYPETCNQMTATEQWIFLCAAHKQPNECPAIDYTRHALDSAASLLNNNKYFPSRVTIKQSSVMKLGSVCRRVYRIFSHAYYHHFQVFDEFEKETHLCGRFSKFVTMYELLSKDSLIVPSDGSKPDPESEPKSMPSQTDTIMIDAVNTGTQVSATTATATSAAGDSDTCSESAELMSSKSETKKLANNEATAKIFAPSTKATETVNASEPEPDTKPKVEVKTEPDATFTKMASPKSSSIWDRSRIFTNTMVKNSPSAAPSEPSVEQKPTPVKSEPTTSIKLNTTANTTKTIATAVTAASNSPPASTEQSS